MFGGVETTVPLPVPTRSTSISGGRKVAVTVLSASIRQLLPQSEKITMLPEPGAPSRLTYDRISKPAEQFDPQLIPGGEEVTTPAEAPVPVLVTVSLGFLNFAVIVVVGPNSKLH